MIQKNLGLQKDSFIKYAICLKRKTLYNFAKGQMVRLYQQNTDMWVIHATHTKPDKGHVVPFWWKLWGQEQERHSCILSRFTALERLLIYYKTLLTSQTPWKTEKWRNRSTQLPDNVLGDCFEGRVWKELQYVDGEPFLAISNNFGLMLNVDWFQPTLHGSESIGVIYMVVKNFQERNASNLKILLLLE